MSVPAAVVTRVIITFKTSKSDEDVIKAFLRHTNRPISQYDSNEHFVHHDLARTTDSKWSHMILDMHSGLVQDPELDTLPHEFYEAKDIGGSL